MSSLPLPDEQPTHEPMPEPTATPETPATAAMTAEQCGQRLKELFPALFRGGAKPIKLRVQADIQERAPGVFSKQVLSAFLRRYTGSTSYLIALANATERFDLDGQPAGELAAEHRQAAQEELARRRNNRHEREALEQQQWRNRAQLLRDFETNRLSVSNFCALKGVAEEELEGLLARARTEREQDRAQRAAAPADRAPRHARAERPADRRPPRERPRGPKPSR